MRNLKRDQKEGEEKQDREKARQRRERGIGIIEQGISIE